MCTCMGNWSATGTRLFIPNCYITGGFSWIREPRNVTAVVGSDVFFPCEYSGVTAQPLWRRDGVTFDPQHDPPPKHSPNETGLVISDVDVSMNMTRYSCFLDLFLRGYYESSPGYITVVTRPESMIARRVTHGKQYTA